MTLSDARWACAPRRAPHARGRLRAPAIDRHASLERVGAADINNASTTFDYTDYYATAPPAVLAYALFVDIAHGAHAIDGISMKAPRRSFIVE
jgi:hypothetical protein